jgi:AcrR family transcriptional regulator
MEWNVMTAAPRKKARPNDALRHRPEDWLNAAFRAVAEGGFESVRVMVLADDLGLSRGSFYWHFADRAALVKALLERWRKRETTIDQDVRAQSTDDPVADLTRVLDAALVQEGQDLENMRFELALRDLGRRDPAVANMLLEVDAARMALFQQKFERLTGERSNAAELAALFYLAIVGSNQALGRPDGRQNLKAYLSGIIASYLIYQQVPAAQTPD